MLEILRQYAHTHNVPIIREKSGLLLKECCQKKSPKRILEIGTAIGYSGILMLNAVPDAVLTTIEKDDKMFALAKENFAKAHLSSRVNLIHDDAEKILDNLVEEDGKFDLIFLDGPKGQYIKYLPRLKSLLEKGGILFTDDIYFHGLVQEEGSVPHKHRTIVNNLRNFISTLENDKDFETKFLDIEDGLAISRLK